MRKLLLKKPIISEKATMLGAQGQYVFMVERGSTKPEIRKAVETTYKVKVVSVNIQNTKDKRRRLGRTFGVKPGYRKAIVTLKEGDKLDVLPTVT